MQSGYRITLTYNLLLRGDTSRPEGDEGTVTELAGLLREHFSTPVPRYYGGPATDPPNRLVYLLDHEYTPRALSWTRLKGADASRMSLLRIAAERAVCEAILALADIKTTHSAVPTDEGYGYPRRRAGQGPSGSGVARGRPETRCLTGGRGLPDCRPSAYGSGFDGIRINAIAPAGSAGGRSRAGAGKARGQHRTILIPRGIIWLWL